MLLRATEVAILFLYHITEGRRRGTWEIFVAEEAPCLFFARHIVLPVEAEQRARDGSEQGGCAGPVHVYRPSSMHCSLARPSSIVHTNTSSSSTSSGVLA